MTKFSLNVLIRCYYRLFQTPFSNKNKKRKEKPTGRWHARNTHVTQTGSSRIFKRMVPVDYSYQSKRSIRNLSFYLSSNSLASFLSQTSNLVHSSLHLVIILRKKTETTTVKYKYHVLFHSRFFVAFVQWAICSI